MTPTTVTETNSSAPPPSAWSAFRAGVGRTLRSWPLVLLFYAALVLLSGLILLPIARALVDWIGHNLAAWEVAEGLPPWLIIEGLTNLVQDPNAASPAGDWPLLLLLSLPAWPFVLAIPSTVLSAGAIAVYAGNAPLALPISTGVDAAPDDRSTGNDRDGNGVPRTDWKRLGAGLLRYTPSFLLLLFLEVTLYELALLLTVLLAVLVVAVSQNVWSILLTTPILALVVVAIPWWFEYARTLAVVREQRNVLRALKEAWTFLLRNLGPAAALALYHFALLLLPYLLSFLLARIVPGTWWALQLVYQQAIVMILLATRLARMAGQIVLVQGRDLPDAKRR